MVEPVDRLELMNKISDIIFDRPYDDFFKGVEAAMRVVSDAPLTQQKTTMGSMFGVYRRGIP